MYSDISQAKDWYRKSASKGYGPAQNKLKSMSKPEDQQKPLYNQQQKVIKTGTDNEKRYYEESIRIAEKSRRAHTEQNCQMM